MQFSIFFVLLLIETMKWAFRPSALLLGNYATNESRELLVNCYKADNERATTENVSVPRHKTPQSTIRTLQWNVHAFVTASYEESWEITNSFARTIFDADPDVIVLNEYNWDDKDGRHLNFEKQLRAKGYKCFTGTIFCPTFLASRLHIPTESMEEIILSDERSALVIRVEDPATKKLVWVVGAHLDYRSGEKRKKELSILLENLSKRENGPTLVLGDLNQQRQCDYSEDEWAKIAEGMDHRKTCYDDGVQGLMRDSKFKCSWNFEGVQTNWETLFPPSTHWSGTIVDYSYGKQMQAKGAYISPAGFSDHRMTLCDWKLLEEEPPDS